MSSAAPGRHRFAPAVKEKVRLYRRLDNWHGPLEALRHWTVILLAAGGSLLAWRELPLWLSIPAYLLALFLIGGRQRGLSGLLHQASHGTFMANRRANAAVAAVAGGWPVLQSYSGYAASHVGAHHGRFGSAADPDFAYFREAGLYGADRGPARFRSYLIGLFNPLSSLRYLGFLLRHRIWTAKDDPGERLGRLVFYALIVGGFAMLGGLHLLFFYWLVPLVTSQAWVGAFAELLEHYPLMERAPVDPVRMSRNRDFGRTWYFLLGEDRGEGYHLVHHLFPHVPIWNLHHVHRELCADPVYAALPFPGTPLQALRAVEAELPCSAGDGSGALPEARSSRK